MKNEIEQIHELKEEANELINFGDSKEKNVGLGMLRVLEYWEKQLNKIDISQFNDDVWFTNQTIYKDIARDLLINYNDVDKFINALNDKYIFNQSQKLWIEEQFNFANNLLKS